MGGEGAGFPGDPRVRLAPPPPPRCAGGGERGWVGPGPGGGGVRARRRGRRGRRSVCASVCGWGKPLPV